VAFVIVKEDHAGGFEGGADGRKITGDRGTFSGFAKEAAN
jgi:hypothetical protein